MKHTHPKPKTPKTPKTRKPALPRSEWDFAKVPRAMAGVVCMREYATECLRALKDDRLTGWLEPMAESIADALQEHSEAANAPAMIEAVRAGLRQRRAIADKPPCFGAPLVELPAALPAKMAYSHRDVPAGAQLVQFAVNWRAGNNEIKRAFGEWIKEQNKRRLEHWQWPGSLAGTLSSLLAPDAGGLPYDYVDTAAALQETLTSEAIPTDATPISGALIEALRGARGERKGRGDSKRALLTDLAIYRLHREGFTARKIAMKLGNQRLKFYDEALIARAVKRAADYLKETLLSAFVCEGHTFRLRDMVSDDPANPHWHPVFRKT